MTLDDTVTRLLGKYLMHRSTLVYSVYFVHSRYDLLNSGAVPSVLIGLLSVFHCTILDSAVQIS